ncbi:5 transmembrane domain protein [Cryptosporidium bovis]|uniref:5 transmembrane domain protein n=1 Tax=Cryptosporidium bovis TaxID=310047 RepID=UPI00351A627A|nr:5 transmembrane domain protein [Cryptosporidium bovis]
MKGNDGSSTLQSIGENSQFPSLRNIRQSKIYAESPVFGNSGFNTFNNSNNVNNGCCISASNSKSRDEDMFNNSGLNKLTEKYWRSSADILNDLECGIVYPDCYTTNFTRGSFSSASVSSIHCTHPFGLFSVSIHPVFTRKNALAIFYSFIPYIIGLVLFAWLLIGDSFVPAYALIMMLTSSASSEFFLKNIFKSPRPPNSACASYGMPSSHCVTSYSILIWLLLENINALGLVSGFFSKLSIIIITAPVPWARWYVEDHTIPQCIWGCVVGILFGIIAFIMRIRFFYTNLIF